MSSENVSATAVATKRTINEEERARKRQAIGLAPRRPTARPTVQRPPRGFWASLQRWFAPLLLLALLVATGLLIVAQATGAPTAWPELQSIGRALIDGNPWPVRIGYYSPGERYRLRLTDNFDSRTGIVACTQQAGEWITDVYPAEGIFRMQLWPGRLTWSTIAVAAEENEATPAYRIDASVTIVDAMPTGYSGFIGRYQDPENFYLFMVDGTARYRIQLWRDGVLTTLQPWTVSPLLNGAGSENILALEENGSQLRFAINGSDVATVSTPVLPVGAVGLLGGAADGFMAEIHVDWLRIYALVE